MANREPRKMINEATQTPSKERPQGKILDSFDVGPPIQIGSTYDLPNKSYVYPSPLRPQAMKAKNAHSFTRNNDLAKMVLKPSNS